MGDLGVPLFQEAPHLISIPADRGDDKASELRETVAAVVLSDPDTWGAVEIGGAVLRGGSSDTAC